MQTLLVTIMGQQREYDLELPGDIPISDLLPFLIDLCSPQESIGEHQETAPWCLRLAEQTTALQHTHTLIDAGIVDGSILYLQTQASLEETQMPKKPLGRRQIMPGPETGGIGVRWHRGDPNS